MHPTSSPSSAAKWPIEINEKLKLFYTLEKMATKLESLPQQAGVYTPGQIDWALVHAEIERALEFVCLVPEKIPNDLLNRVTKLILGVDDPELALIILRSDYPDWKIQVQLGEMKIERA